MLPLFRKILIAVGLFALLTGCASSPSTHFYVLEAQNLPSLVSAKPTQKSIIGIGPISIPALIDRKQIVTRSDQSTVGISEFHQWAAPLKANIVAVLTQNLATLQTRNVIRGYPWSAYGPVNHRVIIDIDRFDTQPGKSVILEARWAIINEKTQVIIVNEHTRIEHSVADSSFPGAVKALSQVLYEFSQQLSLALGHLV